jgi:AraC-like DNA-binding protein
MPIKMISQKFGISIFSIENYFSTRYRANFHSFVETRKMAKAYQLITKGRMLVKQAMLLTGYRNRTTFRRAFKRHFNQTPSFFVQNG